MPQSTSTHAVTGQITSTPWTRAALLAWLADQRYEREVSGITVGGLFVSTERGNERVTWQQLMSRAAANAAFAIRKKMSGTFHALDATQILRCGSLGATYIAACFAVEDTLQQQIAAADESQLEAIATAISADATWPTRTYDF